MKRLTFEGNFCDIAKCEGTPGFTSECPNGFCDQRRVWELLKWYEDAEQEGRLVVLPAKTVFDELTWDAGPDCDMICPVVIDGNECCDFCDKGKLFVYERNCTQDLMNMLGKTGFLTREEAEAALGAQEGGDA